MKASWVPCQVLLLRPYLFPTAAQATPTQSWPRQESPTSWHPRCLTWDLYQERRVALQQHLHFAPPGLVLEEWKSFLPLQPFSACPPPPPASGTNLAHSAGSRGAKLIEEFRARVEESSFVWSGLSLSMLPGTGLNRWMRRKFSSLKEPSAEKWRRESQWPEPAILRGIRHTGACAGQPSPAPYLLLAGCFLWTDVHQGGTSSALIPWAGGQGETPGATSGSGLTRSPLCPEMPGCSQACPGQLYPALCFPVWPGITCFTRNEALPPKPSLSVSLKAS